MERARIFVADDDEGFLEFMRDLLEGERGYSVTVLNAPGKAYDEIIGALPDLVILDIMMNRSDSGWDVLTKLKLNPVTSHLPVIICSGDINLLRDKHEHIQSANYRVLPKPFEIDELLSMTDQALSKSHTSNIC